VKGEVRRGSKLIDKIKLKTMPVKLKSAKTKISGALVKTSYDKIKTDLFCVS